MDFLLAGKRFSLQGQGLLSAVDVQRRYLWKTFRGKPNSVPDWPKTVRLQSGIHGSRTASRRSKAGRDAWPGDRYVKTGAVRLNSTRQPIFPLPLKCSVSLERTVLRGYD